MRVYRSVTKFAAFLLPQNSKELQRIIMWKHILMSQTKLYPVFACQNYFILSDIPRLYFSTGTPDSEGIYTQKFSIKKPYFIVVGYFHATCVVICLIESDLSDFSNSRVVTRTQIKERLESHF